LHRMVMVSSLFYDACTYVCSSCRQRKKEKTRKGLRDRRLVSFSFSPPLFFFSKKNGSIAMVNKKERVCERVVPVVALMTK
jgi:hypothetical protein